MQIAGIFEQSEHGKNVGKRAGAPHQPEHRRSREGPQPGQKTEQDRRYERHGYAFSIGKLPGALIPRMDGLRSK
jgi:hypothetical protein